ncbi:MAG: hypothetical protein KF724_00425 [Phycisphaeraceae bacterium]|nr:hypothetical protein [Phycisphaeraceae bacterium]
MTDVDENSNTTEDLPWDLVREDRVRGCGPDVGAFESRPCPADLSGNGVVDGGDITVVLGAWGACVRCPEDLNGDGWVSGADLSILLGQWGGVADADLDCDGVVGGADLAIMLGQWGECPSGSSFKFLSDADDIGLTSSGVSPELLALALGFESLEDLSVWLSGLEFEMMVSVLLLLGSE